MSSPRDRAAADARVGGGGGAGRAGGGGANTQPRWRCSLTDYTCARQNPPAAQNAPQAGGGQGRGGGRGGGVAGRSADASVSPDGKQEALIQNFNVYVRPVGGGANASNGTLLSTDGSEGNSYTFQSMRWSPDSKKIVAFRRRPGYERLVHYVESSPTDQLQPKHTTNFYRKPGDVVDFDVPVVFDVATKKQYQGDISLFPNPYANTQLEWRKDSRAVTFEYNQRGHQLYRVLELDATTGKTRTLIEETSKTFVEYSGKKYRYDVADGKEIIWASERDGWNHLYLYDGATGQVKNQITKGNWVIRGVDHVDEAKRQIWFRASGMHAGQGPVPHSVLPRELRRHRAHGAHRCGRQSQRHVLADQGVLRRLLVARRFAAAVRAEARERSDASSWISRRPTSPICSRPAGACLKSSRRRRATA